VIKPPIQVEEDDLEASPSPSKGGDVLLGLG